MERQGFILIGVTHWTVINSAKVPLPDILSEDK
jgi:hypothetical protein